MRPLHYFPFSARYNPAEQFNNRSFAPWQFNQAAQFNNFPPNAQPFNAPPLNGPPGPGPGPGIAGLAEAAAAGAGVAGAAGAAGSGFQFDQLVNGANSLYNTAQKFMPIVQQAKPMFNNLPALWKLYKGFKGLPNQDSTSDKPKRSRQKSRDDNFDLESSTVRYNRNEIKNEPLVLKPSVPKIYQPTFEN